MTDTLTVASPLLEAARRTPTALWNDSADPIELERSIGFGAVGATCNPVIALTVISRHSERWAARLLELAEERPTASHSDLGWTLVEELSIEAARLLEPAFRASGGRDGRLSIQTDPRLHRDAAALADQAEHFAGLAENIIVKIPATRTGLAAIEEATFRGVSVNATVSFTVAQAVAVAEAIEHGLDRREAAGLATPELGSVCTIMGGRLDDWLKDWAAREGVLIEPGYFEWAGVAALKRAYAIYRERGYRVRILSAAFRNTLQWSELVGGDLVVSPPFEWQLGINRNQVPMRPHAIDDPVEPVILDTLLRRVPEFRKAYEPEGLAVDDFECFGATARTLRQFLEATADLEGFVRDTLVPAP